MTKPAAPRREGDKRVPRVIAVVNQKGGVGKTTTAVNLAASVAAAERRTLLIDLDPQGNASSGVGVHPRTVERSVYDALIGRATLREVMRPTELSSLSLVPSKQDLVAAEFELVDDPDRSYKLRGAHPGAPARRAVRVRVHRLPAVAGHPDGQRALGGRPGARADAVRVLRARGAHLAHGDDRPRAAR